MIRAQGAGRIALLTLVSAGALAGLGMSLFGTARKRRAVRRRMAEITEDTLEMLRERSQGTRGTIRKVLGMPSMNRGLRRSIYSAVVEAARAFGGTRKSAWRRAW